VADPAGGRAIVETSMDTFGRIDAVVNNAGILRDRYFHKMSEPEWDAVLKVHLYGSYNDSRAAAPHFRQQESSAVVNMTSTAGRIGNVGDANYESAKLGIAWLSRSIAMDTSRFNICSICIAPFA